MEKILMVDDIVERLYNLNFNDRMAYVVVEEAAKEIENLRNKIKEMERDLSALNKVIYTMIGEDDV